MGKEALLSRKGEEAEEEGEGVAEGDWARPTFSLKSLSNVAHFIVDWISSTADWVSPTDPEPSR